MPYILCHPIIQVQHLHELATGTVNGIILLLILWSSLTALRNCWDCEIFLPVGVCQYIKFQDAKGEQCNDCLWTSPICMALTLFVIMHQGPSLATDSYQVLLHSVTDGFFLSHKFLLILWDICSGLTSWPYYPRPLSWLRHDSGMPHTQAGNYVDVSTLLKLYVPSIQLELVVRKGTVIRTPTPYSVAHSSTTDVVRDFLWQRSDAY